MPNDETRAPNQLQNPNDKFGLRPSNVTGNSGFVIWACGLLFLVTSALYARTIAFDFVNYDDDQYVYENRHVTGGLTWGNIRWAFSTGYASNWHPLTWLSLQLDATLFGVNPGPMHAVNALLHAANAALLFVALFRLTGARWPAAVCAGLFALHPLRVESVAWIAERKDLLAGLFWMLSLIAYDQFVRKPAAGRSAIVLAMLALGLMCKPMLVTLPCVLLLLDFWPLRRISDVSSLGRMLLEKLPMFALVIASSAVTFMVQQAGKSVTYIGTITTWQRLANAAVSYVQYLHDLVWPAKLACFYPHPYSFPGGRIEPWAAWAAFGAVGMGSIAAIAWIRRAPWFVVGWFWYVGTLVPVIGLVQVGAQSHADRYTYVSMIGITIAIVWTISVWTQRAARRRVPVIACAFAALLTFSYLTYRQISFWRNSQTLMRHAIDVVPNNYAAHLNLGAWLHEHGDEDAAMREFAIVLQINPNDTLAMNNYAARLAAAGQTGKAKELLKLAIRRDPQFIYPYIQLGDLYAREQRFDDAISVYRQALDREPDNAQLHHSTALSLAQQGKLDEAIDHLRLAAAMDSDDPTIQHDFGVALAMAGRAREGIDHLRAAISLDPRRADSFSRLAWILATHPDPRIRNPDAAESLANRAVELTHSNDASALDSLAAAQAARGRYTEAVETARRALALAIKSGDQPMIAGLSKRISLYESGRAYIQGQ